MAHLFVSLGGDYRSEQRIRQRDPRAARWFFDGLITPLGAVIPLIEARFADAFESGELTWWPRSDGWEGTDRRYGAVPCWQFISRQQDAVVPRRNLF